MKRRFYSPRCFLQQVQDLHKLKSAPPTPVSEPAPVSAAAVPPAAPAPVAKAVPGSGRKMFITVNGKRHDVLVENVRRLIMNSTLENPVRDPLLAEFAVPGYEELGKNWLRPS